MCIYSPGQEFILTVHNDSHSFRVNKMHFPVKRNGHNKRTIQFEGRNSFLKSQQETPFAIELKIHKHYL